MINSGSKLCSKGEKEIEEIFNDMERIKESFAIKKAIGQSKRIDDVIGRYIVLIKKRHFQKSYL